MVKLSGGDMKNHAKTSCYLSALKCVGRKVRTFFLQNKLDMDCTKQMSLGIMYYVCMYACRMKDKEWLTVKCKKKGESSQKGKYLPILIHL